MTRDALAADDCLLRALKRAADAAHAVQTAERRVRLAAMAVRAAEVRAHLQRVGVA
jgi:hypothetical protein